MIGRIRHPSSARQLIDFEGLVVKPGDMYPTDIDGIIEYRDSEYILFEVKHKGKRVPKGQWLALQRMVDDFTAVGKQAIAIVCEHDILDPDEPIILANCDVRNIYYGRDGRWSYPATKMKVKEAVDLFHNWSKFYVNPDNM